ncbi:MAG: hypothetical protein Q9204_005044 [Flavoplaca sp. TL-2023a]
MADFISRDVLLFKSAPNVPALENFLRRSYHSSTTVGDFVYIDGGEVLQLPTNNDNGAPTGKLAPTIRLSLRLEENKASSTAADRIPPDVSCWQFTADGAGGGLWDMFSPADDSIFHQLTRPDSASGATVDNTGFILKGVASARTSPETLYYSGRVPIPGIVSFNITSNLWQNDTMPQYVENLSAPEGLLASVDAFGTDGLVVTT